MLPFLEQATVSQQIVQTGNTSFFNPTNMPPPVGHEHRLLDGAARFPLPVRHRRPDDRLHGRAGRQLQ